MAGGWIIKLTFSFMDATHKPLHLGKRSLVQWNFIDIPTGFISIVIFFKGPFEYVAVIGI
jgi:hypothetical protein